MTVDAFDDLVSGADGAMIVVTAAAGGERAGCLVGFHTQSSIEPPRYAVWLSKANHTYRVAMQATHLAVHVLTTDDRALAVRFGARTGDDTDKFAGVRVETGSGGAPVLVACRHLLVGRRVALHDDGGDHVCVVLEPVEARSDGNFTPLRLAEVADLSPGHEADA